jgi:hypothetical protein
MSLKIIRKRHNSTLFIDWAKEFDPEWQPSSLSNAEQCHTDRDELLIIIEHILLYTGHKRMCDSWRHSDFKCDCGFDKLMEEIK